MPSICPASDMFAIFEFLGQSYHEPILVWRLEDDGSVAGMCLDRNDMPALAAKINGFVRYATQAQGQRLKGAPDNASLPAISSIKQFDLNEPTHRYYKMRLEQDASLLAYNKGHTTPAGQMYDANGFSILMDEYGGVAHLTLENGTNEEGQAVTVALVERDTFHIGAWVEKIHDLAEAVRAELKERVVSENERKYSPTHL